MKVFVGNFVHTPTFGCVEVLENYLIVVDSKGWIMDLKVNPFNGSDEEVVSSIKRIYCTEASGVEVKILAKTQFFLPGMVDTHFHAPQYVNAGFATDVPLMEWLDKYTFPAEKQLSDSTMAKQVYHRVVEDTLKHGTTTALYFGTIHLEASKILADLVEKLGQRGYVGKVCMDRNSPSDYIEETAQSLKDTEDFVLYVLQKGNPLVQPVITPRFIPTCTIPLLEGLSRIAAKYKLLIQSHISESIGQVQFTKHLHPNLGNGRDTAIFDACGLLTDRTVMAHGTMLFEEEVDVLRIKGTGIAHCPLSNFYFGDALFPVRKYHDRGLKIGLGTDISGGYHCSVLSAITNGVITSKALSMMEKKVSDTVRPTSVGSFASSSELNWKESLWFATLGGASLLGLSTQVGSFAIGKAFDAILIDFQFFMDECIPPSFCPVIDRLQKYLNIGDDRNIKEVYVQGRQVVSRRTLSKI